MPHPFQNKFTHSLTKNKIHEKRKPKAIFITKRKNRFLLCNNNALQSENRGWLAIV